MQQIDNKIYTGKILSFNGQFGFIESELGSTFFHKTGLNTGFTPEKNTPVEFKIKKSTKKLGMFDAYKIAFNKNALQKELKVNLDSDILDFVVVVAIGHGANQDDCQLFCLNHLKLICKTWLELFNQEL